MLYLLDTDNGEYFCEIKGFEYYNSNKLCASSVDELKNIIGSELDSGKDYICLRYSGTILFKKMLKF